MKSSMATDGRTPLQVTDDVWRSLNALWVPATEDSTTFGKISRFRQDFSLGAFLLVEVIRRVGIL